MKQEIPWNRLAVEAFVIVASILLAFAIDAWWTRYQESIEEQELLTGLRAEFLVNQELAAKKNISSSNGTRKSSFILAYEFG